MYQSATEPSVIDTETGQPYSEKLALACTDGLHKLPVCLFKGTAALSPGGQNADTALKSHLITIEVVYCIWSKTCIWSKFCQNFIYYETIGSSMHWKLYFFLEECLITPTLKLIWIYV